MKKIAVYSFFCLFLLHLAKAQEIKISREYTKAFPVGKSATIEISNKYGEIIINTWQKDSVKFAVTVESRGKSNAEVEEELDRVDIDIRKIGLIFSARTEIGNSRSGFFGSLLNQVEDYSKSVLGGGKLEINYEVYLPADVNLSIENKFGDIYLSNCTGRIAIDLSHGDLRVNRIEGHLQLKHDFGRHTFDFVRQASISVRNVESRVAEAGSLFYQSSSSQIDLGKVRTLQIDSRNDRYKVAKAFSVSGDGSFTDMILEYALNNVTLEFDYGDLYVGRIDKDFDRIALEGKSSDINLILDQASYIDTYIAGPEDKMILPNSMLMLSKEQQSEQNRVILTGFIGNTNTNFGKLKINAEGGELIIAIKETSIFTNKE